MPADVNLLTTKAECDQAFESLTKEKAAYQHRDTNQAYADGVATDRATTLTAQLAKATDDVAHYTAEVARPGLTPAQKTAAQRALIAATARQGNLQLSSAAVTGPTAYLADVDADQVDAQIATLDSALQAVSARKAALPN
jgi:hypothetical protein